MSEPKAGEAGPGSSPSEIRARLPRHKSVTFERGGVPEPSRHRRGIFPIGLIRESSDVPRSGSRRRQKCRKHRRQVRLVNRCLSSLNWMAGFGGDAIFYEEWDSLQEEVVARVDDNVSYMLSDPTYAAPSPHGRAAFAELARGRSLYDDNGALGNLATYKSDRVSLPSFTTDAVELARLLGHSDRLILEDKQRMLRDPVEVAEMKKSNPVIPYVDPVLRRSKRQYERFVRRLYGVGIVDFTLTAESHVGLFFVHKKNGTLRFIQDARVTNMLFKDPPPVSLLTPEYQTTHCSGFV